MRVPSWRSDLGRGRGPRLVLWADLLDARRELTAVVAFDHLLEADDLDLAGLACGTEGFVAFLADTLHRLDGFLQVLARIELLRVFRHELADRTGRGQTQVGVDVDLAHPVPDAFDDLLERHAVGFLDGAAVLVDDREPVLRHRGRSVHDQMRIGDARV